MRIYKYRTLTHTYIYWESVIIVVARLQAEQLRNCGSTPEGTLGFSAKRFDWLWSYLASYLRSHRGKVGRA
jgi:hypothetical protein